MRLDAPQYIHPIAGGYSTKHVNVVDQLTTIVKLTSRLSLATVGFMDRLCSLITPASAHKTNAMLVTGGVKAVQAVCLRNQRYFNFPRIFSTPCRKLILRSRKRTQCSMTD